ncbi:MAG TPA: hypothetical protein VFG59_09270 [Anaeromyxobacter sp.]|nr:hypothetical protein [Anaeromyxobacter sp.]
MLVCPVCEHSQAAGSECEVCGRRLPGADPLDASVSPLEGLQPTLQVDSAPVEPELVPGLEPTRHAALEAPVAELVPGLEPAPAGSVDVAIEPLAGLERTGEGAGDEPTPYPAVLTCRYCRTEAAPGERLCSRCGMRLPLPEPAPAKAEEAAGLCSCGAPRRGGRCPACGARA